MERVVREGEVATANTLSRVLSALPRTGSPARVMFYDLHTLQNRFYFHTGAIATMHSGIPLVSLFFTCAICTPAHAADVCAALLRFVTLWKNAHRKSQLSHSQTKAHRNGLAKCFQDTRLSSAGKRGLETRDR